MANKDASFGMKPVKNLAALLYLVVQTDIELLQTMEPVSSQEIWLLKSLVGV